MKPNKKTYVLWSGGLDSTYLIQKLLDEDKNRVVMAGYVELLNNDIKIKMEKSAIEKMVPFFKKHYQDRFQYQGVVMQTHVLDVGNAAMFTQMPIWINAIVSTIKKDTDEIAIGYAMNDDAISFLNEIKQILRSYQKICYKKFPKIIFPLSKEKKEDFICEIYDELKKNVVWCEQPRLKSNGSGDYDYCGRCVPCRHSPIVEKETNMLSTKVETFVETFNKPTQMELTLTERQPTKKEFELVCLSQIVQNPKKELNVVN